MDYIQERLNEVTCLHSEEISVNQSVEIIYRTTYILQSFVYWDALLLSKTDIPNDIKEMFLADIMEEVSDLDIWTHAALAKDFRDMVERRTNTKISNQSFSLVKEKSAEIISHLKSRSFLFWLSFMTTLENYNSMDYLAQLSKQLWIDTVPYIIVHQEVDHKDWGHADIFKNHLESVYKSAEKDYKEGVDFAINIIRFRLWK